MRSFRKVLLEKARKVPESLSKKHLICYNPLTRLCGFNQIFMEKKNFFLPTLPTKTLQTSTDPKQPQKGFLEIFFLFPASWGFYRPNYINHVLMIWATIHFTAWISRWHLAVTTPTSRTPQNMTGQYLVLRDQFDNNWGHYRFERVPNMLAIQMKKLSIPFS